MKRRKEERASTDLGLDYLTKPLENSLLDLLTGHVTDTCISKTKPLQTAVVMFYSFQITQPVEKTRKLTHIYLLTVSENQILFTKHHWM